MNYIIVLVQSWNSSNFFSCTLNNTTEKLKTLWHGCTSKNVLIYMCLYIKNQARSIYCRSRNVKGKSYQVESKVVL